MQGVFAQGERIKTKKGLKLLVATVPHTVRLEATSIMGNEYDGPVTEAPDGKYYIVGPDPYNKRSWYANITKAGDKIKVE
jgi:hypothetical protein